MFHFSWSYKWKSSVGFWLNRKEGSLHFEHLFIYSSNVSHFIFSFYLNMLVRGESAVYLTLFFVFGGGGGSGGSRRWQRQPAVAAAAGGGGGCCSITSFRWRLNPKSYWFHLIWYESGAKISWMILGFRITVNGWEFSVVQGCPNILDYWSLRGILDS